MQSFGNHLLNRPIQQALITKVLQTILTFGIFLSITGILTNLFTTFNSARFTINTLLLLIFSTSHILMKRDAVLLVMKILIFSLFITCCVSVLGIAGVMSPNYFGYLLIIVTVSVISSNTKILLASYVLFVLVGALSFLPVLNLYEQPTFPAPFRIWTMEIVYGFVITSILYFARQAYGEMILETAKREALLSSIFASMSEPLIVSDRNSKQIEMNASAQALDEFLKRSTGVSLLQSNFIDIQHNLTLTLQTLLTKDTKGIQNRQIKLEGDRPVWYEMSLIPQQLDNGILGSVIVLRDLTDQYDLMEAQKMSAVGVLANGIAHDFNNMLGAISNASELLSLDLVDEEQQEMLGIIIEATQCSSNLVNQLKQFSKINTSTSRMISVEALLNPVLLQLQRVMNSDQELILSIEDKNLEIRCDETQIQTAITSLGMNALQALKDKGVVHIQTYTHTLDESACQQGVFNIKKGHFLCIQVEDNGIGIDPEIKSRIFEPFFTTKDVGEGVGLGLSTVYGAAQSHQGMIEVESTVDEGTIFRFNLPIFPNQEVENIDSLVENDKTKIILKNILIIDDEYLIRRSLQAMLKALKINAYCADHGDQGMAMLREQNDFDLIILDMQMPGKTGREIFYELKAEYPHIPVILSSGFSPEGMIEELMEQGLSGVLNKPYLMGDLKKALSQVQTLA